MTTKESAGAGTKPGAVGVVVGVSAHRESGPYAHLPDRLELELRSVFAELAAKLDPSSIDRLRAIDYHPRIGVAQRIRSSLALLPRPTQQ
jgi:hypothetical protein